MNTSLLIGLHVDPDDQSAVTALTSGVGPSPTSSAAAGTTFVESFSGSPLLALKAHQR